MKKLPGDIILVGCIWRGMIGKNAFSAVSDSCNVFIIKVLFGMRFLKGKYISELLKRAQRVVDESTAGFQVRLELCGFDSVLLRTRGPRSSCTAVKKYMLWKISTLSFVKCFFGNNFALVKIQFFRWMILNICQCFMKILKCFSQIA